MSTTFSIRQGDLLPVIRPTLQYANGDPIDLGGVSSVKLLLHRPGSRSVIEKTATVYDAQNGIVEYAWLAGDTDVPGDYEAEWEITFVNGGIMTVPNRTKTHVLIPQELG